MARKAGATRRRMKRIACVLLFVLGCGRGAEPAVDDGSSPRGRAGESCASSACEAGLTCRTGRGSTLCYPQSWFTGEKGAFCFHDADCNAGLGCDDEAANPFSDGLCVVKPNL